ncbi:MAG TPA: hypothetical protein GXZ45_07855, partial [Propionibacterium sp.]|nr:hypothetical protein [Propionibacterium sp.]
RAEAPSPSRARVRGDLLAAAQDCGRDHTVDWAGFEVRDLPGGPVRLRLDDPFAHAVPAASELAERMRTEPRHRVLGGFVPPPDADRAGPGSGPAGR